MLLLGTGEEGPINVNQRGREDNDILGAEEGWSSEESWVRWDVQK